MSLVKLHLVSTITIALVFAIIAGIIGALLWYSKVTGATGILFAIVLSVGLILVQWAIGPVLIKKMARMKPLDKNQFPQIYVMVGQIAKDSGLPMPSLYLVEDKTPNAFAFGRSQKSSSIAVHSGLLDSLNNEEIRAVLAHEVGHIKNRDVLALTIASVLPVLLYYVVLVTTTRDDNNRNGGGIFVAYILAMIVHFIAQLVVLWLSRTREYYADEYSGYLTKKPIDLMRGLTKITYAAAKSPPQKTTEGLRAFYISDPVETREIHEIAHVLKTDNNDELEKSIRMEKARGSVLQLFATHPSTANRLLRLLKIKKRLEGKTGV